jgi:eukaryotic-like serine/threonine-protein kinase
VTDEIAPGDRVDQWVIQERLGEGGFATVYKARHADNGQQVALKMLNTDAALDKNVLRRFMREASTSQLIDHPNIVRVLGFGDHARQPFIVLELLSGENLADRVKKRGALDAEEAVPILVDVTQALARAHDQDIIHRDLKPENLFLTPSGVKVLDFGIAKFPQQAPGDVKTATRAIIGTLHTMSPEQCRSSNIDARSDIYSLGVVAWFLLAAEYPFAHAHDLEIAVAHLKEAPPPLRDKNPRVPAALADIVHKCMQKEPRARYQSMRELRDALQSTNIGEPARSGRGAALWAALIALIALGAAAWLYLK